MKQGSQEVPPTEPRKDDKDRQEPERRRQETQGKRKREEGSGRDVQAFISQPRKPMDVQAFISKRKQSRRESREKERAKQGEGAGERARRGDRQTRPAGTTPTGQNTRVEVPRPSARLPGTVAAEEAGRPCMNQWQ